MDVVCSGSPSLILSVRLISLGMTTLPSSSILRTIPVALIIITSNSLELPSLVFVQVRELFAVQDIAALDISVILFLTEVII